MGYQTTQDKMQYILLLASVARAIWVAVVFDCVPPFPGDFGPIGTRDVEPKRALIASLFPRATLHIAMLNCHRGAKG